MVVLDGDGSLLMNLGTLVTIAAAAPRNFVHFVSHNGTYEANGGMPLSNRNVDLAGIARSAGYRHACTISELADFEAQVGKAAGDGGAGVRRTDADAGQGAIRRTIPTCTAPTAVPRCRRNCAPIRRGEASAVEQEPRARARR